MSALLDWAAALGGPAGVVAGVVGTKLFDRHVEKAAVKNSDADAAEAITRAALVLLEPLTARVETLEKESLATKTLLQTAIGYIRALRTWIDTHIPDKTPPQPPASLGL